MPRVGVVHCRGREARELPGFGNDGSSRRENGELQREEEIEEAESTAGGGKAKKLRRVSKLRFFLRYDAPLSDQGLKER